MDRMQDIITILCAEIPVREGTQLYDGFVALKKCDGKTYQSFRDLAGGPAGKKDRKFSPSTVRRKAEELGFAAFGAKGRP